MHLHEKNQEGEKNISAIAKKMEYNEYKEAKLEIDHCESPWNKLSYQEDGHCCADPEHFDLRTRLIEMA
jgi:hypothetical protein